MTRKKKVKRSRIDLLNEMNDQVSLLINACHSFDKGFNPIAKHIALSLRTLLHHHGQSRALLEQLKMRGKYFLDTAGDIDPNNLISDCNLCVMRMGGGKDKYLPSCAVGGGARKDRWLPFSKWWNLNVVKDSKGRYFSRRQLVLNVANTDGGAHVDPELDEAYMDLSRNNSLGWIISDGNIEKPFPPPTMACIRQIAHEFLETLKLKHQDSLSIVYEPLRDDR